MYKILYTDAAFDKSRLFLRRISSSIVLNEDKYLLPIENKNSTVSISDFF